MSDYRTHIPHIGTRRASMSEDNVWALVHQALERDRQEYGDPIPMPGCSEQDIIVPFPALHEAKADGRSVEMWRRDVFGKDHLMDTYDDLEDAKSQCQFWRDNKSLKKQTFYLKWGT